MKTCSSVLLYNLSGVKILSIEEEEGRVQGKKAGGGKEKEQTYLALTFSIHCSSFPTSAADRELPLIPLP